MKFNIKNNLFHFMNSILGLILALTPFVLFPVCNKLMKNGKPMPCHYSGLLIVGMGLVIVIVSVLAIWLKKKWLDTVAYLISLVAAVLSYMIPKRIIEVGHMKVDGWQCGLCKSPTMSCQTQTMPAVSWLVGLLVLSCVVALIIGFVKKER